METERNDSSLADIALDGDVVFLVGTEEKRLRVYSLFKDTSKYFNALLGPHFSEGQNLGNKSLTEIPLLDDNAEAMAIIFNIIHGRNSVVRESPDPDEILQIAIAADKFDWNSSSCICHQGLVELCQCHG